MEQDGILFHTQPPATAAKNGSVYWLQMRLHPADLVVIVAYVLGMALIGWRFSRKQDNIKSYFLSDRNVPWWAIAGSIVATETSTVTFIGVPAFAFASNSRGEGGDFTFLQLAFGYLIGRLIITALLLPQYFRAELLTVYQVLDRRFARYVKRTSAALFLVTRSLADGVRLFATAIVLAALTGWPEVGCILIVGVVTIMYTCMGGMSAVLWSDVIQLVIYVAGALVAALVLIDRIPGGLNEVTAIGSSFGKFRFFDLTGGFDRNYTLWSGVIGGAFLTTATHGTDQMMVQRYLCSKTQRQAAMALLGSGIVVFAQFALFLFIGVLLFVFYNGAGGLPAEVAARADRVFPHFIVTELPPVVVGLVVAAVFAAAMSTLSSSLNSSAATSVNDFYAELIARNRSDSHYLRVSRLLTVFWGLVQIAIAIAAIAVRQRVLDSVLAIASFTNGPILGLFLLGRFKRRVSSPAALFGAGVGISAMTFVWLRLGVSWQWYVLIGSLLTFGVGYLSSLVIRRRTL